MHEQYQMSYVLKCPTGIRIGVGMTDPRLHRDIGTREIVRPHGNIYEYLAGEAALTLPWNHKITWLISH